MLHRAHPPSGVSAIDWDRAAEREFSAPDDGADGVGLGSGVL
jgi:hypothetical protein